MTRAAVVLALTVLVTQHAADGQSVEHVAVPIRTIAFIASSPSTPLMANIADVRHLPDGRVLVNDRTRRKVLLFDASLTTASVVFGDITETRSRYGPNASRLLPYLADSSVFADPEASALIVLDPAGKIVRSMGPPKARDVGLMAGTTYGTAGFDPSGRVIYQGSITYPATANPWRVIDPDTLTTVKAPTTGPIVRADFDTRRLDTLAWLNLPFEKFMIQRVTIAGADGPHTATMNALNPLPTSDDWTLLSDGTVAIVRARDYHIDWVHTDGTTTSTPRMPFDWRPISAEEKRHILDSAQAYIAEIVSRRPPRPPGSSPPFTTVDAADLPDFHPPIRVGETRSDRDGNVWILPATVSVVNVGLVYDVVNRNGELVHRVRIGPKRSVVGFGPRGIVYLRNAETAGTERLERWSIVQ